MGLRCGWKGTDRDTRGIGGWIKEMEASDLFVLKTKVGWEGWFSLGERRGARPAEDTRTKRLRSDVPASHRTLQRSNSYGH